MKDQINEPITIKEAKSYLRLDSDYEDDNLIQMIRAVREAAEQYLRCSLVGDEKIAAPIKQGMLIHLVSLFELRGGDVGIPSAVRALYNPYRKIML